MQTFYIGNSILGEELANTQQLLSDIMNCFEADVLNRARLWRQRHPIGEPLAAPMGAARSAL